MKIYRNITVVIFLCLSILFSPDLSAKNRQDKVKYLNSLELYQQVTSLTMAFNEQYGKKFYLPVNAKDAIGFILKNSNTRKYMGSKDYNSYNKHSEFSNDANNMMQALTKLIEKFEKIGFISEILAQGKTPAIMFDIDNTIELTSFADDYWTKV